MLDANIHNSLETLTASQLAKLLVMRKGLDFDYGYVAFDDDGRDTLVDYAILAAATGEQLDTLFGNHVHDDAINEVREDAVDVSGIPSWCDHSWERHFEVDVKAFILPDGRALAFCEMSGGGKFGDPNSYPWVEEAKFIKVADVKERIIKTYTFEEMPADSEAPEA